MLEIFSFKSSKKLSETAYGRRNGLVHDLLNEYYIGFLFTVQTGPSTYEICLQINIFIQIVRFKQKYCHSEDEDGIEVVSLI